MKKSIIQGVISIGLFFGMWFSLKEIDWVRIFKVEKITDKTEQKLGDIFWEGIKKTEQEKKLVMLLTPLIALLIIFANPITSTLKN